MMSAGRNYSDRMMRPAVDGQVIPPTRPWIDHAVQVICGHDVVQALDEARQADFQTFVRDVLRTELK
jgi:hypothetical protein